MMNWCNPNLCMCRRIWSSIEATLKAKRFPKNPNGSNAHHIYIWRGAPVLLTWEQWKKTPQKAQKKEPRLIWAGEENSRTLVIRCERRPGPHKESDPLGIIFVHSPLSPCLTYCLKQNSAPISEFLWQILVCEEIKPPQNTDLWNETN
jgi:hypothetical protein